MSRVPMLLLLGTLAAPQSAAAQDPTPPVQGDRVRVGHRCRIQDGKVVDCRPDRARRYVAGSLQTFGADTVRVLTHRDKPPVAFPAEMVDRFWVSRGKKSSFGTGAGVGAMGGLVAGGLIGATTEFCALSSCDSGAGIGALIGAGVGLVAGGFIGLALPSDRWVEVSRPGLPLRVAPSAHGLGIQLTITL